MCHPYDRQSWACYDKGENVRELDLIDIKIEDFAETSFEKPTLIKERINDVLNILVEFLIVVIILVSFNVFDLMSLKEYGGSHSFHNFFYVLTIALFTVLAFHIP